MMYSLAEQVIDKQHLTFLRQTLYSKDVSRIAGMNTQEFVIDDLAITELTIVDNYKMSSRL